jgi:sugar lactone lactonase YvrE
MALALLAACGGGSENSSQPASSGPALELFAGTTGGQGYFDAQGNAAEFWYPEGIAVDGSGTVYVADTGNRVIRRITPQGQVSTLAGSPGEGGFVDGAGGAARFGAVGISVYGPGGLAVDVQGNVYVADTYNHAIRKVTPAGVVSTLAGTFSSPIAVAVDRSGNVYVSDPTVIRKISPEGVVTTVADGTAPQTRFGAIRGMAFGATGELYMADWNEQVIRKLAPDGTLTTLAGTPGVKGRADGAGAAASFYAPVGLATDAAGNLYVAEAGNRLIRKISLAGIVTTIAGNPDSTCAQDGTGSTARFSSPSAIAIAPSGTLYVAEDGISVIRAVSASGDVTTFAGAVQQGCFVTDGTGAQARFGRISDMAVDSGGNLLVVDAGARRVRKVTSSAQVTTFAASLGVPYMTVAIAPSQQVYVAAYQFPLQCGSFNSCDPTGTVSRMAPTGEITPVPITGSSDTTGGQVNTVAGMVAGQNGDLLWTDDFLNVVRRLSPAGDLTTMAGTRRTPGALDGVGQEARFNGPAGLVADAAGNAYVADFFNHTLRKISPGGVVTTIAGSAGLPGSNDGLGTSARFNRPLGLAIDEAGNLYVADSGNCLVRKVSPSTAVTTVAGTAGRCGFVAGSLPGSLDSPLRVAVTGRDLYISMPYGIAVVRDRP